MPAGQVLESNNTVSGTYGPFRNPGPPVNGTNSVQTLTIGGTPTGGTFSLSAYGFTTGQIAWSATNATLVANVQAAMDALIPVGAGNTVVAAGSLTAGVGTITITFSGAPVAHTAVPAMSVAANNLTGTAPTVAMANTTPGVRATFRDAGLGAILQDITNAALYQNASTTLGAPNWTQVTVP